MSRASVLSSNCVECVAEEKITVDTLKENGYLLRFIYRHSHCSNVPRPMEEWCSRISLTIPYISGIYETIRRILKKCMIT